MTAISRGDCGSTPRALCRAPRRSRNRELLQVALIFRFPRSALPYTWAMRQREAELLSVSLDPNPVIEAYKDGVDRTLLRENLKLTTGERVVKMISALRFAEAVRRSRPQARAK